MASEIPAGAYLKEVSARFNDLTIPRRLRVPSQLPPELWGLVAMEEGEVSLFLGDSSKPQTVTGANPGVIPPETPFKLASTGKPARFQILYYHEPKVASAEELSGLLSRSAASRRPSA